MTLFFEAINIELVGTRLVPIMIHAFLIATTMMRHLHDQ